jgi:hypothetical protein
MVDLGKDRSLAGGSPPSALMGGKGALPKGQVPDRAPNPLVTASFWELLTFR